MDVDKYLLICEQLGEEPDPQKMPLELSDFPAEIQVAFFLFGYLEDNWEGTSGTYMGKIWTQMEYLFELYNIDEPKVTAYFMKLIESIIINHRGREQSNRRKAAEKKSASGEKNFTHNVKG